MASSEPVYGQIIKWLHHNSQKTPLLWDYLRIYREKLPRNPWQQWLNNPKLEFVWFFALNSATKETGSCFFCYLGRVSIIRVLTFFVITIIITGWKCQNLKRFLRIFLVYSVFLAERSSGLWLLNIGYLTT